MARTLARGPARLLIAPRRPRSRCSSRARLGQIVTILAAGAIGASRSGRGVSALPLTLRFPIGRRHRDRVRRLLRRPARRLAARGPSRLLARSRPLPGLLPGRSARLRRRARRAAAPQRRRRRARLGLAAGIPRRLRRRAGRARARCSPSPRISARSSIRRRTGSRAPRSRSSRSSCRRSCSRRGAAAVGRGARARGRPGRCRRHRRGSRRPPRRRAVGSRPHTSVHGVGDAGFAAILFGLLRLLPPWAVVGIAAVVGAIVF